MSLSAENTTGNTTGNPVTSPAQDPVGKPVRSAAGDAGPAVESGVPADPQALIAARRVRIDEIDAALIGLVRERMTVSREIQEARIGSGGRRVHLAREMDILRTWGDALGKPGTALAMTLLELCRGQA
ncbi:chorismate mutase [Actinacidiphila acididurans]|uniref:Chorismate mutase n=1 Tax=Actinacidiphila acididurans TaxID=2784346 RepID=A0ABS2TR03_9ACTN|nr:chorismate mutase [Actinacidiphila acididurans]MBM9504710.1 chorismate mutase [Actinacidiphila acididurans]